MRDVWRDCVGRLAAGRGREAGSAVAEFAMVSVLLLVLAMGVFQLGLALYVRNSLIAAASEGARNGARADATPADAADRTASLIRASLSAAFAEDVSAREQTVGGARVVEVTVTAPIPVIGLIGPSGSMTVTGRAFSEAQVGAG
jgi:Flp pilus assembly protein TadG